MCEQRAMDTGMELREISGVSTRKRLRAATPLQTADPDMATGAAALQVAISEIKQLHEERLRQQADFEAMLRQRDEELQRLRSQLSPFRNRASGDSGARNADARETDARAAIGFKLKPDTFDGTVPLREFFS